MFEELQKKNLQDHVMNPSSSRPGGLSDRLSQSYSRFYPWFQQKLTIGSAEIFS